MNAYVTSVATLTSRRPQDTELAALLSRVEDPYAEVDPIDVADALNGTYEY